ncbi:YeeE/YedE family protein [soil metagenome]
MSQRSGNVVVAVVAGVLFVLGLIISGMVDPSKITAFLDVRGHWDGSLMFVMAAAIAAHLPIVRLVRAREASGRGPLFGTKLHWPDAGSVDAKLLLGAAIVGVGLGLSGYCPGPAVVSVVAGGAPVLAFIGAMLVGLYGVRLVTKG